MNASPLVTHFRNLSAVVFFASVLASSGASAQESHTIGCGPGAYSSYVITDTEVEDPFLSDEQACEQKMFVACYYCDRLEGQVASCNYADALYQCGDLRIE